MKHTVRYTLLALGLTVLMLVVSSCEKPAYYDPYGDKDASSITTNTVKSGTQASMTALSLAKRTTTTVLTTTTQLVIPDGYMLCPTCHGVKQICPYCNGTGRRQGESYDENSGIYKSYTVKCNECSSEDPGYMMCETCHNALIVPIEETETGDE